MEPAYQKIGSVNIGGIETDRLMVVLKTRGCEYARQTGGCTVCGFFNHAREDITDEEILAQLDYAIGSLSLNGVKELDLLTLGSFFNDNEVSGDLRQRLLRRISRLEGIKKVSFESRAEYVTLEKLQESKALLKDKIVEFAIGLESADDYIRNSIIKKGLSKKSFERVISLTRQAGCNFLVYLLIKPPGLSEKEAIADAVSSVKYVFETTRKYGIDTRVAFEPVFVCQNTRLEDLYLKAEYRLLNLWSIVEVIKKTHRYGTIFVGLSDENLSMERMPNSCHRCYQKLVAEIERFNRTQDITRLCRMDCRCKSEYDDKMRRNLI